jgi:glycosyltransferase involved in cell wall biosynthesis/SAM-dependent methyltransferase
MNIPESKLHDSKPDVNLIGMPFGEHGLGQELRDKAIGLISAGISFRIFEINYSSLSEGGGDRELEYLVSDKVDADINIICLNLTMFRLALRDFPEVFEKKRNIILPFWEFDSLPAHHVEALKEADEVWTPNQFLTNVFSRYSTNPVNKMPLHVRLPAIEVDPQMRERIGLGPDDFTFLMMFDCNSMVTRKDPEAAILAFIRAFESEPSRKVRLILKYKYENTQSLKIEDVRHMEDLAKGDSRIILLNEKMSRNDTLNLINVCDVYLSPHRAEGLGRALVESMLFGKVVVATAYSGVQEYLSQADCVRLPYVLIPVGSAAMGDIKPDLLWALPDFNFLTKVMLMFADSPEKAKTMGQAAQKRMENSVGSEFFGAAVVKRLKEINEQGVNRTPCFPLESGERQTDTSLNKIRLDHISRYNWAITKLEKLLQDNNCIEGADVFCGNGYGASLLSNLGAVWAVDKSEEAIKIARKHYGLHGITYETGEYPFEIPVEKFDYVVSIESVEHVKQYKELVSALVGSVKDGGYIIISTPNQDLLPYDMDTHKFHEKHFTIGEVNDLFSEYRVECIAFAGQTVYEEKVESGPLTLVSGSSFEPLDGVPGQFNLFLFRKTPANEESAFNIIERQKLPFMVRVFKKIIRHIRAFINK